MTLFLPGRENIFSPLGLSPMPAEEVGKSHLFVVKETVVNVIKKASEHRKQI